MDWPDDAIEDDSYRQCLLDSVEQQGGEWNMDEVCKKGCTINSAHSLWPSSPGSPSGHGVILHTSDSTNMAWRVPVGLFSVRPDSWFVADGMVHWYCNGNCADGGFEDKGGCGPRDGGIMNWPDDVPENTDFRECLLDSIQKQGGQWDLGAVCSS